MFEFWVRLGVSVVSIGLTYGLNRLSPNHAFYLWTGLALYATGLLILDRQRKLNPGVQGFVAVTDAAAISLILGASNFLDSFGFLVLIPCAYAAARYGSRPSAIAPIAAGNLFLSHQIFLSGEPNAVFYGQVAGVLGIGLMLNQSRIIVSEAVHKRIGSLNPLESTGEDYLELRENFRKLKEMYRDLERKGRKDRISAKLLETRFPSDIRFFSRIAEAVKELTGADGTAIYGVAQYDSVLVVRGSSGDVPTVMADSSLTINLRQATAVLKDSLARSMMSLQSDESRAGLVPIPLQANGKTLGMMCLRVLDPIQLDNVRESGEEIAPLVAKMIVEELNREPDRRRLREAELLYETAVVTQGAETATMVASRVLRELSQILEVDHLSVHWVDEVNLIQGPLEGTDLQPFEVINFAGGFGELGWFSSGSPEVVISDTSQDPRCNPYDVRKKRIGSLVIMPIRFDSDPFAVLVAATHRSGGLDFEDVDTLRTVTGELGRALAELETQTRGAEGLVTAVEFQKVITGKPGALVTLQPIRQDAVVESISRPMHEQAVKKFVRHVRSKLYAGGVVCRRPQGDIVAFLPYQTEHSAQSWANEIAASASLIGVRTYGQAGKVPFAVRAKVAIVTRSESLNAVGAKFHTQDSTYSLQQESGQLSS